MNPAQKVHLPRILVSAPRSGCGKTTVVCGLLRLFSQSGLCAGKNPPAAVKCGPDYIDPLFHHAVTGAQTGNIDLFFTPDEKTVRHILAQDCAASPLAVIEGAMGLYDGTGGTSAAASAYHTACVTQTPVVLVVDAKGASLSLCAEISGMCAFTESDAVKEAIHTDTPAPVAAVILNRCSAALYEKLRFVIEKNCGVRTAGYVCDTADFAIESRHLGLVTPDAVESLTEKIDKLAQSMAQTVDLHLLTQIAQSAPDFMDEIGSAECTLLKENTCSSGQTAVSAECAVRPRIAVARDSAFCFLYRENLDVQRACGADIVFFSPLKDESLPAGCSALYLCGGYPELFPAEIASNTKMNTAVRAACRSGMPVFAECGGFLYLQMLGVLPGTFSNTGHLVRFGYVTLTAERDTLLCRKGDSIRAHEFHYFDSTENGSAFTAHKASGDKTWPCIQAGSVQCSDGVPAHIFAGFPHLYFYSNIQFAQNFVRAAEKFLRNPPVPHCAHAACCAAENGRCPHTAGLPCTHADSCRGCAGCAGGSNTAVEAVAETGAASGGSK